MNLNSTGSPHLQRAEAVLAGLASPAAGARPVPPLLQEWTESGREAESCTPNLSPCLSFTMIFSKPKPHGYCPRPTARKGLPTSSASFLPNSTLYSGRAHLRSAIILCLRLCHPAFLTLLSLLTKHILFPAAGLSSDPTSSERLPHDAATSAQAHLT